MFIILNITIHYYTMTNKIILYLFLASYLGLSSCGKKTKPTVSFINDLNEESRSQAKDGSYIYSHFLNVNIVRFYNERKIKKTDVVADLKLYHISGFKKQSEKAVDLKYKLFAGDSSETFYPQKDSALMVLMGFNATITDMAGNKVAVVNNVSVPVRNDISKIPSLADTTNVYGKCISVSEHVTSKVTDIANIYYKNMNIFILNNPLIFKKNQKYKLYFMVFDKMDPNRYFEGETIFTAY